MPILDLNGNPIKAEKPSDSRKPYVPSPHINISVGGGETLLSQDSEAKVILKNFLLNRLPGMGRTRKERQPQVGKSSRMKEQPIYGKEYPGSRNLLSLRTFAWSSTVVYSIITFRRNQMLKREPILIPKIYEPPFKFSLLDYSNTEVMHLPELDDQEKYAVLEIFKKIDPYEKHQRKGEVYDKNKNLLTSNEIALLKYLDKKHQDFHTERNRYKRAIISFLNNPDPYYSEESTWEYLLAMVLEDLLILDRGAIIKIRNDNGKLVALTAVDGTTIRPVVNEQGFITHYCQVIDNQPTREYIDKKDVILLRQNLTPDAYMYGYGIPPMEVLYTTVLSDLFIDKGNVDYYRKGGSIPEGFINVEPPGKAEDGTYVALDQEQLDAIQRQMQAIIMSDFTQVPIVSGGKFTWIDFKGKRRDMQFKELAEYLTRKICAVFQVSPQDVGVLSDVNRATAETMHSLTKSKGLETLASIVSRAMTNGVVDELRPQKDLKLWFKDESVENRREWWTMMQGQLSTGYVSINEARAEEGKDPVPWGDTPLQGLQNWASPESQPVAPGMPGGAGPLPPGLDAVSQAGGGPSPVPIPGQIPGMAPALGQAPSPGLKSVLSQLLENTQSDFYNKQLDVSGLVKTLVEERPLASVKSSLFSLQEAEQEIELIKATEFYLERHIRRVALRPGRDGLEVLISVPDFALTRENCYKILSYLINYPDPISFEMSPGEAVCTVSYPVPLSPFGEGYINSVTKILYALSGLASAKYIITTKTAERPGFVEVQDGQSVSEFLNKFESEEALWGLVRCVSDRECFPLLRKKIKSATKDGITLPAHLALPELFKLADNQESLNEVLDIANQIPKIGKFFKNVYRALKVCYGEGFSFDYAAKHRDLLLYDDHEAHRLREAFKKISTHEEEVELVYRATIPALSKEEVEPLIVKTFAYLPELVSRVKIEEVLEKVKEAEEIYTKLSSRLDLYALEIARKAGIGLVGESYENQASMSALYLLQNRARNVSHSLTIAAQQFDTASTTETLLPDSLLDALNSLNAYFHSVNDNPFEQPDIPLPRQITSSVHQCLLLMALALGDYVALKEHARTLLEAEQVYSEFPEEVLVPVETVTEVVQVVTDHLAGEYQLVQTETLRTVVKGVLFGLELGPMEKIVLQLLKDRSRERQS